MALTPQLPPKNVADDLVDGYIRTSETVYRILHIPTFRKRYEAFWASGDPDEEFLAQLKLVMAIGAIVYDDGFSLRSSVLRWIYEAHTWTSAPKFKARLSITAIQNDLLLAVAREMNCAGGEPVWITAGALVRKAMHMGLHRDPDHMHGRTALADEMHRRIWNTILELSLQSSMTAGGPPLLSLCDFDTNPPGNFDDEQLLADDPVPKPEDTITQTSVARALRKTLPQRLAVTKALNDLGPVSTYDETLRLDAELRSAFKSLRRDLRGFVTDTDPKFEVLTVELWMHRYLSALHAPFFGPSLKESAYAFSRKVVVESSLQIWSSVCPKARVSTTADQRLRTGPQDLERLMLHGFEFHRTVGMQSALLLAVELRTLLQEEESLNPMFLRPDLVAVVSEAKEWSLRCIEAGETNVKAYFFVPIVAAHIEGLRRRLSGEALDQLLVKAVEEVEPACLPILQRMVAVTTGGADGGCTTVTEDMPSAVFDVPLEDWDFMVSCTTP